MSEREYRVIYVTGLPRPMPISELADLCDDYGAIVQATVERDPETGAFWGFGFVEFHTSEAAAAAAAALHGRRYRGGVLAARMISAHPDTSDVADR